MIEYCKLIISLINVEFPLMEWFFLDLFEAALSFSSLDIFIVLSSSA